MSNLTSVGDFCLNKTISFTEKPAQVASDAPGRSDLEGLTSGYRTVFNYSPEASRPSINVAQIVIA